MKFSVFSYFLSLNILLTYSNPGAPVVRPIPGSILCGYYGNTYDCTLSFLPAVSLPETCSGFVFDGFVMDQNNVVQNNYGMYYRKYVGDLVKVKPTYVTFNYQQPNTWDIAFNPKTDLKPHVEALKTFCDGTGISGLILINVFLEGNANLDDITQKLQKYVETMKTGLPGIAFGLDIPAIELKKHTDCKVGPDKQCLDFTILSTVFEFIIISFYKFNECNANYVQSGIVPVTGQTGNTLTNFAPFIKKAIVSPLNVLLIFDVNDYVTGKTPTDCYTLVDKLCSGKTKFVECLSNSTTLYEMGSFAKSIGASIIGGYVNFFDGDKCECGLSFPGFQYLVNGFNNGDKTLKCAKFDARL